MYLLLPVSLLSLGLLSKQGKEGKQLLIPHAGIGLAILYWVAWVVFIAVTPMDT